MCTACAEGSTPGVCADAADAAGGGKEVRAVSTKTTLGMGAAGTNDEGVGQAAAAADEMATVEEVDEEPDD